VAAALLLHTSADPDLWGHLAFGRATLAAGLPRTDGFSYTAAGAPFMNHEWLSDVVTYGVFALAGPAGLVGLRLVLLGLVLLLIAGAVRRAGGDALVVALVTALVVVGAFPWFVTARPQLWTFAGFAFLLVALARADDGDLRPLVATPLVTVAWVNLHGGVVAGLAVLALWGGLRLVQAAGVPWRRGGDVPDRRGAPVIGAVLALQLPAALANPFGPDLWRFFADTLGVRRVEIAEWQPVSLTNLGDALGLVVIAAMAAMIVVSRRPRDPVHLLLLAVLAAAAASARRHLALAVIAAAVLGAPHAAAVLTRGRAMGRGRRAGALAAAAASLLLGIGLMRAGCIVVEPGTVPRAAVAYLERAGVRGNLAVLFDWGDYVIWHLAPRLRVSIDGRREAVYSPAQLDENATFLYGRPGWRAGLDRDGVDVALVSPRFAVWERFGAAPDWRLAFADDTAGVFVRRGSPADAALGRPPPPETAAGASVCLGRGG
jgi:hypothetical protein